MKFIKKHYKLIIILISIIAVYIYGWYEWKYAGDMQWEIWESGGWDDPVITYIRMHQFDELAFMKTMMIGGFVFGSLLLLLNIKKK
jgi:hypothetical protein